MQEVIAQVAIPNRTIGTSDMSTQEEVATRRTIAAWMKTVLAAHDWSSEEWARRADVTATTITRLIKDPVTASLPNTETLAKLARAAGSQPYFVGGTTGLQGYAVALADRTALIRYLKCDGRAQAAMVSNLAGEGPTVIVSVRPSARAIAVAITNDTLSARGVFPGDIVVVEPVDVLAPTDGSIVVAIVDEKIGAYVHQPPFLMPVTSSGAVDVVRIRDARIIGRGIHLIRKL
jgi:SOS-response transcriptional repressor LexA